MGGEEREEETTGLVWSVDIIDFDPDTRERTFKIKITAAVQPVPSEAVPGTPVRPVVLEGLSVTPYIKEEDRPRSARLSIPGAAAYLLWQSARRRTVLRGYSDSALPKLTALVSDVSRS